MIELKKVSKSYPSPQGVEDLIVLKEIELVLDKGDSLSVMGPSGSGKSTLLNLMGSMDVPSSGDIMFDSQSITSWDEDERAKFRASDIGFIFQNHRLLPQCTVLENVLLPCLTLNDKASEETVTRARILLEKVGLSERVGHYPSELSGGECQRVAVVRALINEPKLILADEPTGALDKNNAHSLMTLLSDLVKSENVTMVVVTHDSAMADYTSKQVYIQEGQLVDHHD